MQAKSEKQPHNFASKKKTRMARKIHVVMKGKSYQKSLEKRGSPEQFSKAEYDI